MSRALANYYVLAKLRSVYLTQGAIVVRRYLWAVIAVTLSISCGSATKKSEDFSKNTSWLEQIEGEEALTWVRAENQRTQSLLEADPRQSLFQEQIGKILNAKDRIPFGWFQGAKIYNFWQDEKNIRGLLRRTTLADYRKPQAAWESVLDLDQLARQENENWVYGGLNCLPAKEGACLLSLSRGGKDADVVREFDLQTKKFVTNGFVLPEAKSSVTWWNENTILVGTDWGPGTLTKSGYPRQVRIWRRGQDSSKAPLLFEAKEEDLEAGAVAVHRPEGQQLFVYRQIDFYNREMFWVPPEFSELRRLPLPNDAQMIGLHQGQFLLTVRNPWLAQTAKGEHLVEPGDVVSFNFDEWLQSGKLDEIKTLFKTNSQQAYLGLSETHSALYVLYLDNVQSRLLELKWEGNQWKAMPIQLGEGLNISFSATSDFRDDFMLRVESFLTPTQLWYRGPKAENFEKIKQSPERFDATGLKVEQLWAVSPDGTKIPYFSIGPKEAQVTAKPTILTAYGGFEISSTPYYSGGIGKIWLERGGRYVVANIRGGGEFGPRWHQAGVKENRPRIYEDFIAVAEDLIRRGLTTKEQLGIMGGSNGGLLMGVAFTKRPDLFAAIDCQVPLLDMLNYHHWLAGASWVGEYGSPDDPKMREVLLSYSPLHNVDANKKYPEILFVTSTKDDRVHPAHARKMAYLLKELKKPFLYYENIEGGHGAAANLKQRAYRTSLEFTYFSQKLNLP